MSDVIGGNDLNAWLMEPDCPQCGSEDVTLKESYKDMLGRTVNVWYCNKCGHTWTEITA